MQPNLYLGVMTGTSLDGIDIALCRIDDTHINLLAYDEYPYDVTLKQQIQLLLQHPHTTLKTVGRLDAAVGEMIGDALQRFMQEKNIDASHIVAAGVHGQTLWHTPQGAYPFSWQIGDANRIARQTGLRIVSDVRRADMAAGGQGAPLAPLLHRFIFKDMKKPIGVLNLGGIANLTILEENDVTGFDTGPANTLIDAWIARHKHLPYDKNGDWARGGNVHQTLLQAMLSDAYFSQKPPKSTGRERFNLAWVQKHLADIGDIAPQDVQRTLTELTARSIADAAASYDPHRLIVCGGGAHNAFLLERIRKLTGITVEVSPFADAMEAMLMAYLAFLRICRIPALTPHITGASEPAVLGALYEP